MGTTKKWLSWGPGPITKCLPWGTGLTRALSQDAGRLQAKHSTMANATNSEKCSLQIQDMTYILDSSEPASVLMRQKKSRTGYLLWARSKWVLMVPHLGIAGLNNLLTMFWQFLGILNAITEFCLIKTSSRL